MVYTYQAAFRKGTEIEVSGTAFSLPRNKALYQISTKKYETHSSGRFVCHRFFAVNELHFSFVDLMQPFGVIKLLLYKSQDAKPFPSLFASKIEHEIPSESSKCMSLSQNAQLIHFFMVSLVCLCIDFS